MRSILLTAVLLSAASLPAQGATVTLYGTACRDRANQSVAPMMRVSGVPQLGSQITVQYLGPNGMPLFVDNIPALITGLTGVSVPVPQLTMDMSSSCTLLVIPDIAFFVMPRSGLAYLTQIQYTIPNDPSVLGASVYHQWATLVLYGPSTNPTLGYVMFSNGAHVQAGL